MEPRTWLYLPLGIFLGGILLAIFVVLFKIAGA